jgi:hypothetical protein
VSCGQRGCWHAMRARTHRRRDTNVSPTWSRHGVQDSQPRGNQAAQGAVLSETSRRRVRAEDGAGSVRLSRGPDPEEGGLQGGFIGRPGWVRSSAWICSRRPKRSASTCADAARPRRRGERIGPGSSNYCCHAANASAKTCSPRAPFSRERRARRLLLYTIAISNQPRSFNKCRFLSFSAFLLDKPIR